MSGEGIIRLGDLAAGPVHRRLRPDAASRADLARQLGLEALPGLEADLDVRAWLDGCQVQGRFRAEVTQICGVSLEAFTQAVSGEIDLRFAPAGSPNLPEETGDGEVEVSLETPDPPERLEGDFIDLAAILGEHLVLAIDPFPRRPGAVFEWTPDTEEASPFAALRALKPPSE